MPSTIRIPVPYLPQGGVITITAQILPRSADRPEHSVGAHTERTTHEGMSQNDEVKPFHAKDVASGQEAADVVAAVIKHAAERDKAAHEKVGPKKQPKWMLPVGLNLGVFAAYLLIWSPPWVVLNPIAPPPTEDQVEQLSGAMWFAISGVEGFRMQNERLPQTLAEAGVVGAGLDYTVQGASSYVLIAEVGAEASPLVYNSAQQTPQEWGAANAAGMSRRIGG